jgi:origin recognition complex subunit 2
LPEHARGLFRLLVAEQLAAAAAQDGGGLGARGEGGGVDLAGRDAGAAAVGLEYRVLYHRAREELVCSTEHQLRTLLKEFYDHQMVESTRDALGTERLVVPFRKEELEMLLEDLVE